MTQRNVEWIVGRLITDEAFRSAFASGREAALAHLVASGVELNPCERHALAAIDPGLVEAFAERLDPRIQKSDLLKGCQSDPEAAHSIP